MFQNIVKFFFEINNKKRLSANYEIFDQQYGRIRV